MTDKSMRFSCANEIAKLDKFNGTHSRRWKGKMYFLVALKLAHVLNEEKLEEEEEETRCRYEGATEVGARRFLMQVSHPQRDHQ